MIQTQLSDLRRQAIDHLVVDDPAPGMEIATLELAAIRGRHAPDAWRHLVGSPELAPLRERLHEDPYTRRGFDKPRGYPGDAVLLDYIYGVAPLPDDTTALGRSIYGWCSTESQAFVAVRERCRRVARLIDEMADERPHLRVMSIACGHLREVALSHAVRTGRIEQLVALDQDPESLRVVAATTQGMPVQPLHASVGDLVRGRVDAGEFDLIYATGLYDYLEAPVGAALLRSLAERLRPGGRVVVGNFLQMWEAAYIEAFMDWWLAYRTPAELHALADGLDERFTSTVTLDPWGVIAYLEVTRVV